MKLVSFLHQWLNREKSHVVLLLVVMVDLTLCSGVSSRRDESENISAVGDSGMRRDNLGVAAIESWNQCNEVGEEAPQSGSPRAADCFDIYKASPQPKGGFTSLTTDSVLCSWSGSNLLSFTSVPRAREHDKKLRTGEPFLGLEPEALFNVDLYAVEKEIYLGSKCQAEDTPNPWHFWMRRVATWTLLLPNAPKMVTKSDPLLPITMPFLVWDMDA